MENEYSWKDNCRDEINMFHGPQKCSFWPVFESFGLIV